MGKIFSLLAVVVCTVLGPGTLRAQTIPLGTERTGHAASLLQSGKVLITGGLNETTYLDSALLYDPATGLITPTGSMVAARANHTSTLLNDGRVLITGGEDGTGALQTAELYDPVAGTFALTRQGMKIVRTQHTATLLSDGTVLVEGGKSADIFDPTDGSFNATTGTPINRKSHRASLLADGTVLVTGGYVDNIAVNTAEIYNPTTKLFTLLANNMKVPRANHTSTLLPSGVVFITGGFSGTSPHNETEIYDPVLQTFTFAFKMTYHRSNHVAILQGDGRLVVIGGVTLESGFLAQDEVYDPSTGFWTAYQSMLENRGGHTATMLQSGQIFVAGGVTGSQTLQSAEILDPVTHTFTPIGNMNTPRNQHRANLLNDGTVLLTAGSTDFVNLRSNELFDPSNNSFSLVGTLVDDRKSHTATLLQDGRVLVAGGKGGTVGDLTTAEVYDPSTQLFHSASPMNEERALHSATLLNSGQVLVVGGVQTGGVSTDTTELFDPSTEMFTLSGTLHLGRKRHRASLLLDGNVIIEGGNFLENGQGGGDRETATAELYDTGTGLWSMLPDMSVSRSEHESTLLEDGTVLVTGGTVVPLPGDLYDPLLANFSTVGQMIEARGRHVALRLTNPAWGSLKGKVLATGGSDIGSVVFGGAQVALDSVELYDPDTQQFSLFGNMTVGRQNHTATELTDGSILITGGVGRPFVSTTAEVLNGPTPSPTPTPSATPTPSPTGTPPTVTTLAATNVTTTGATFNGSVNPRGIDTSFHFDYGKTTSYGSTTAITDAGSGSTNVKVAVPVTGLDPATLYHFRISATNAGGTSNGADLTMTTATATPTPTPTPSPSPAKPLNISTRAEAGTGENVIIGGFIITGGSTPKKVVIRAIGPSLSDANPPVPGALADPLLELHLPDGSVVTNDNWQDLSPADQAFINDIGLTPASALESVIVATLAPVDPGNAGNGFYTAIVKGVNDTTGAALVEVYDLDAVTAEATLANISTRGFVQTKDSAMIGGFIAGAGTSTGQVLIRAIGPSLAGMDVGNPLLDPTLELHNASGATVADNDNWADTDEANIQATGLAPTNPAESAILTNLASGAYTAVVRGKDDTIGVGLVEVYYLP